MWTRHIGRNFRSLQETIMKWCANARYVQALIYIAQTTRPSWWRQF